MVIVDGFDKWLYLRPLILSFLRHAARDLGGIAFNACNESVGKWVRFRAGVEGLYDDNLSGSIVSEVLLAVPLVVRIPGLCGRIELK